MLQERSLDYLSAARLSGENAFRIMFVEILPNVCGPILVEFTVRLGYAIFGVATLSFLGFGVQPPTPDWGADMSATYRGSGRLLVGDRVPGPRHRLPRRRRQPHLRLDEQVLLHDRLPRGEAAPTPRPPVEGLDVVYQVRGNDRLTLRDVSF